MSISLVCTNFCGAKVALSNSPSHISPVCLAIQNQPRPERQQQTFNVQSVSLDSFFLITSVSIDLNQLLPLLLMRSMRCLIVNSHHINKTV